MYPKKSLKNSLKKEGHYNKLSDDELFIGSAFCGDLSFNTKNDQKSTERFYKRFSLIPNKPF